MCQNVINFGLPNQTFIFPHNFVNISGPDAYIAKPIFALKSWAQAKHFEYNEAYERNKIVFYLYWAKPNKKVELGGLKLKSQP